MFAIWRLAIVEDITCARRRRTVRSTGLASPKGNDGHAENKHDGDDGHDKKDNEEDDDLQRGGTQDSHETRERQSCH